MSICATEAGKSLSYNKKEVFEITQPDKFGLPSPNVSSSYIFALGTIFLYPNHNLRQLL